jgi:nicotinate dehydrogenase subunit B
MLHSLIRAIHEEVQLDNEKVTSMDWSSHPTLTHADVPERIDVILVNGDPKPNRPDLLPYGGGEAACKPMLAAVASASRSVSCANGARSTPGSANLT